MTPLSTRTNAGQAGSITRESSPYPTYSSTAEQQALASFPCCSHHQSRCCVHQQATCCHLPVPPEAARRNTHVRLAFASLLQASIPQMLGDHMSHSHSAGNLNRAGGAPEAVVALPHRAPRGADLVGQVALGAQAAELLARRREAPQLPVLVDRVHDPVDARVLRT